LDPLKQYIKTNHPDIVRILRLIKYELEAWRVHFAGALSRSRKVRQLRGSTGLRLNIAGGSDRVPGWVSMDVSKSADIRMDLRRRFPLPDNSVALIFCEHFCDHLNFPSIIQKFLAECHRILQPGGRARFVMHDAEDLARAYVAHDGRYFTVAAVEVEALTTDVTSVNKLFRFNDFHQFLYDYETFRKLLTEAGFTQVERCAFRQSVVPELVLDQDSPSREVMSMYIEAVK
jgi:predicted SAM-dependent methyltransferase